MNNMEFMQGLLNLCCIAVPAFTVISIGIISRRRAGGIKLGQGAALTATDSGETSGPVAATQE